MCDGGWWWGGGPGPGVPPDCSLVYSGSSLCLKDMEMLHFGLNERDFPSIGDAFIYDMHTEAYTQAYVLSQSKATLHFGIVSKEKMHFQFFYIKNMI